MNKSQFLLILYYLLVLQLKSNIYAAKITVTNTEDSGPGSLRNAISIASPGDTIVFISGLSQIFINSEIEINKSLSIIGPASFHGSFNKRAFIINSCNATVLLDRISIGSCGVLSDAYGGAFGGAIYSCANLVIRNSSLFSNKTYGFDKNYVVAAKAGGGAIFSSGTLYIDNSSISSNFVFYGDTVDGGAIYSTGKTTILNSSISYNEISGTVAGAGGIHAGTLFYLENSTVDHNNSSGTTSAGAGGININTNEIGYIRNSTISSNRSSGNNMAVGGIYNTGKLTLTSVTLTKNTANFQSDHVGGSGILSKGDFTIENTIVAENGTTNAYGVDALISGVIHDLGYNLIGIKDGSNLTNPNNKTGTVASPLNPELGTLTTKGNGGSTPTHALLPGSPAIDAGNPSSTLKRDQRGKPRPFNGRIDIGSFEWIGPLPQITITSPSSGSTYTAPANITITATATHEGEPYYFRVSNPSGGYRKLKIGYDSLGIYHGSQNVLSSGNNMLEITLRDSSGKADWTKIQIRPNGITQNPLSLDKYVKNAGGVGSNFTTIHIPLSDFDPSIDFTQLKMFELPYSINAAPFIIGIQKIIFTGGSIPFLWFGDQKVNNAFDGTGGSGELVAELMPPTGFVTKVAFYNGTTKIGEDSIRPYSITWKNVPSGNYEIIARATLDNGLIISSAPVSVIVIAPAANLSEEKMSTSTTNNTILSVYPNPVSDRLRINASAEDLHVTLVDESGSPVIKQMLTDGEVNLSTISPGIYILRLESKKEGYTKTVKLIKQ